VPPPKLTDPSPATLRKRRYDQRRREALAQLQERLQAAQAELARIKGEPAPVAAQRPNRIAVFDSPRAAMLAVIDGMDTHLFHCCSDLPYDKIDALIEKFKIKYPDLLRDANHAYRRRKKGMASHRLIVYKPKSKENQGFFVLQSSHNDDTEKWQDARNRHQRITVYDYECLRLQAPQRPKDKSLAWTWKIKEDVLNARAEQIIKDFRMGKPWVEDLIKQTTKWAGFAGVRQQHIILGKYITATWIRLRSDEPPKWPRLSFVTRKVFAR
jgi:hypothetical protein